MPKTGGLRPLVRLLTAGRSSPAEVWRARCYRLPWIVPRMQLRSSVNPSESLGYSGQAFHSTYRIAKIGAQEPGQRKALSESASRLSARCGTWKPSSTIFPRQSRNKRFTRPHRRIRSRCFSTGEHDSKRHGRLLGGTSMIVMNASKMSYTKPARRCPARALAVAVVGGGPLTTTGHLA